MQEGKMLFMCDGFETVIIGQDLWLKFLDEKKNRSLIVKFNSVKALYSERKSNTAIVLDTGHTFLVNIDLKAINAKISEKFANHSMESSDLDGSYIFMC